MFQHSVTAEKILKVQTDKRRAERVKSAFSGAIIANDEFVCHCVIKDVSNTGMKLHVPKGTDLPAGFEIKTPAVATLMSVQTQWRSGEQYGVIFIKEDEVSQEAQASQVG